MKICRILIDERRNLILTDEQAQIFQRKYFKLMRTTEKQSFENNDKIRERFLIELDEESPPNEVIGDKVTDSVGCCQATELLED